MRDTDAIYNYQERKDKVQQHPRADAFVIENHACGEIMISNNHQTGKLSLQAFIIMAKEMSVYRFLQKDITNLQNNRFFGFDSIPAAQGCEKTFKEI